MKAKPKTETKPIGRVYPPATMFLRNHVGEAKHKNKICYEMSTNTFSGEPIIHCTKTGKWFILSWGDVISLAETAGIDKP